jgi:hypothetical protein
MRLRQMQFRDMVNRDFSQTGSRTRANRALFETR